MPTVAQILAQFGLVNAEAIAQAAQLEGIDPAAAATSIQLESGGRNIWGGDTNVTDGTYTPEGPVTQANYLAYREAMTAGRIPRNGVGPAQCTSAWYQDTADALGGAWIPLANCRAGFRGLQNSIRTYGLHDGAMHYNGSGSAAQHYADTFMAHYATWKTRLAGATPSGGSAPPAPTTYGNLGIRGLDYSAGKISGATIKAAGYSFVARYVDSPKAGLNSKHIRPDEYADLVAAGVDTYLVFEVNTTDMLAGHDAGVANASRARAGADWIGYPAGGVIFMACDMHINSAQLPAALAYIDGAVSVLGDACGVYGFYDLVDACIAQSKGKWFWQAGISPDPTDAVHIWQRNDGFTTVGGIQCDINELRIPISKERDMTPDESARLARCETYLHAIYEQFAGGGADLFTPGKEWPGWGPTPGGTPDKRTTVDWVRQLNQALTKPSA